ncbi:MAG: hypothetical protein ACOZCP_01265 [Pseudomonadota bacterium]
MAIFKVLGSDGDTFCKPLGEDDNRWHALALAREHHEAGQDVLVVRVLESGIALPEASGRRGEPFIDG